METSIQFKILTSMRAMSDIYKSNGKEYLTNDINPFFNKSIEVVEENLEYAKEVYKKVYRRFLNSWVEVHCKPFPNEFNELCKI